MNGLLRRAGTFLCLWLLASAASGAEHRALSILLTNDDGYAAPGLRALLVALRDLHHRVTVVAPRDNQSGSSVRITTEPLAFREEEPDVWAVDGSPADAVGIALDIVLPAPPDLVISGANRGQNLGTTSNLSGTVGAAVMAAMRGLPAIAVSVGIDLKEAATGFPSTTAAYSDAARFVAQAVDALAVRTPTGPPLPPRTVLNVNYPALAVAAIKGVRWAALGPGGGYALHYEPTGEPGHAKLAFGLDPATEPDDAQTDTALFARGFVTLTWLDGSWQADTPWAIAQTARLAPLVALPAP